MASRYFVDAPITRGIATLTGSEAHHLLHVMRAKVGAEIVLFDGGGDEFLARVTGLDRAAVELEVLERREADRELPCRVTLGAALPKGDRQRWLVEKAVELGVAQVVPLRTERGVAQPVAQTVERLRRSVIEASKQCGRNRLMEVASPQSWADFVSAAAPNSIRLLAHPAAPLLSSDHFPCFPWGQPIMLAIGPEGGFTEDELALAQRAGWQSVSLGPRILRVETAAVALAACVVLNAP